MPQAIAAFFVNLGVSYGYAQVLGYIGFAAAAFTVGKLLAPKKPRAQIQPTDSSYSGTLESRKLIFGKNKIGGMNVIPPIVTGSQGQYLHQVTALGQGPVNAITDVYFDQAKIDSANIGTITGADTDGVVTAGTYINNAWIRRRVGTASQAVDFILDTALTNWTSAHQGKEIADVSYRFKLDQNVYKGGQKPEVSAIVEGLLLYDPRKDSTKTGGSGAHRDNTASTWTYGSGVGTNNALALRRYLTAVDGLGELSANIDESNVSGSVQTAAGICDETVSLPASGSEPRFTFNAILDSLNDWQDNIKILTDSMMGACYWSGGKWRIFAGKWSSSAFSLSEADIAEVLTIEETPAKDRFNAVKGSFIDPTQNYQPIEFPPRTNSTFESEDLALGRVWKELELQGCHSSTEAQRYAQIVNALGRRTKSVTAECFMTAFKVRPFETGTVTCAKAGWTNQSVRCRSWTYSPDKQRVRLVLSDEQSFDRDDPLTTDYGTGSTATAPSSASYKPNAPTALTAVSAPNGITLTVTPPAHRLPGELIELWTYTSITPFASATKISESSSNVYTYLVSDFAEHYFWTTLINSVGQRSDNFPASNGVLGVQGLDLLLARPIPDPYFELLNTQTFWKFYDGSSGVPTNISIVAAAGVIGGVLRLVGDATDKRALSNRTPQYPVTTTQQFNLYFRWRRTTALTYTIIGSAAVRASGFTNLGGMPPSASVSMSASISLSGTAVNAVTINQWQEANVVMTTLNAPKSGGQYPFAVFYVAMDSNVLTGTIEVDSLVATAI